MFNLKIVIGIWVAVDVSVNIRSVKEQKLQIIKRIKKILSEDVHNLFWKKLHIKAINKINAHPFVAILISINLPPIFSIIDEKREVNSNNNIIMEELKHVEIF